MPSYIALVAAKNAAIRPTPMHGAFSTDAYSNGCATNAVANSFVPFLRTTAIQSWPGARSNALEFIEYLSGGLVCASGAGGQSIVRTMRNRAFPAIIFA